MNIESLICDCEGAKLCGPAVDVKGISSDSRKIEKGYLFAALKGVNIDGGSFIGEAIAKGATVILLEDGSEKLSCIPSTVSTVLVPNGRKALGLISARYYGNPSDKLRLVGITGTNGKTTTSYILESIVRAEGRSPGVIGTVNYRFAGKTIPAPNTTPEPSELQRILAEMLDAGTTDCIMEVSSHAIDQERISGCSFDTTIFTNLTMDHLDYHGTMEEYGRVKEGFFINRSANGSESGAGKVTGSIINIDDAFGMKMAKKLTNVLTYSLAYSRAGGDIFPLQMNETADGMKGTLKSPAGRISIDSTLIGSYNLSNIMAAAGAALSSGICASSIEKGIKNFKNVPGRTERVSLPKAYSDCRVFVDYAHTPDALERVIKAIRPTTKGRIITLFGCGGDRDKDKRPLMGNIAMSNSDFAIITSDNPRSEDPISIIAEIEKGALKAGGRQGADYTIIVDRRKAINDAAAMIKSGDTLLLAGKGHEDYQIVKGKRLHFDDAEEAQKAFAALSRASCPEELLKEIPL
ncbi:MAG: UDP-N-acetylmuramoyl-L-alanyl-D-glutamate--2,6-diaminopimelate ligase [bacterium]|nr:UDP-N-acetylmuramoyl-L-alanyl-D-glutamate--2,6-diaminopimelate ligase [bacterium]